MLIRLGIVRSGQWENPAAYGIRLSVEARQQYSFVSELSEDEVADMLLFRYANALIPSEFFVWPTLGQHWIYLKGSHFCPLCLKESEGVWLSDWKLPWSFVCARHKVFLIDECPKCGRRPRAGRVGGLFPAFYERVPQPVLCNNSVLAGSEEKRRAGNRNSQPCGCSFADLPGSVASEEILGIQSLIDQRLTQLWSSVEDRLFFTEMKSVCNLIAFASEYEDFAPADEGVAQALFEYFHGDRKTNGGSDSVHKLDGQNRACAALMAGLATKAISIICSSDSEHLEGELSVLARRAYFHPKSRRWRTGKYYGLPPRIAVALDRCMEAYARFDRHIGAHSMASRDENQLKFGARNVPQLFSREVYVSRFRRFFRGQAEVVGRRCCSIAAVKLLGVTWRDAGKLLELPLSAVRTAQLNMTRLRNARRFNDFAEELRNWAQTLSRTVDPVDYQLRRDALRSALDFPRSKWMALCKAGRISPGYPGGRSRFAAAWMWAEATGGDWRLSPALRSESRQTVASRWKRMVRIITPAMQKVLRAEAEARVGKYRARRTKPGLRSR
jgi:hypothetical protein